MAVFDAVIRKHFSVHVKKHCFLILHGMRHFYTLRCPAPFWLIQCKPYQNRFITAKVIDKSLGARFLWPTVYLQFTNVSPVLLFVTEKPIDYYDFTNLSRI